MNQKSLCSRRHTPDLSCPSLSCRHFGVLRIASSRAPCSHDGTGETLASRVSQMECFRQCGSRHLRLTSHEIVFKSVCMKSLLHCHIILPCLVMVFSALLCLPLSSAALCSDPTTVVDIIPVSSPATSSWEHISAVCMPSVRLVRGSRSHLSRDLSVEDLANSLVSPQMSSIRLILC